MGNKYRRKVIHRLLTGYPQPAAESGGKSSKPLFYSCPNLGFEGCLGKDNPF